MAERYCGRCHTCGHELRVVLDGEEWCDVCSAYRRYESHGWAVDHTRPYMPCPEPAPLPVRRCEQCGRVMGPVEWLLGPVCGECCRANHAKAVGAAARWSAPAPRRNRRRAR